MRWPACCLSCQPAAAAALGRPPHVRVIMYSYSTYISACYNDPLFFFFPSGLWGAARTYNTALYCTARAHRQHLAMPAGAKSAGAQLPAHNPRGASARWMGGWMDESIESRSSPLLPPPTPITPDPGLLLLKLAASRPSRARFFCLSPASQCAWAEPLLSRAESRVIAACSVAGAPAVSSVCEQSKQRERERKGKGDKVRRPRETEGAR